MLLVVSIDERSDGRYAAFQPRCWSEANVRWSEVDVKDRCFIKVCT
jgi:hypothetical protein